MHPFHSPRQKPRDTPLRRTGSSALSYLFTFGRFAVPLAMFQPSGVGLEFFIDSYDIGISCDGMYTSPFIGLKAIACQLWAPSAPGSILARLPVLSYRIPGISTGRPVFKSMPLAQVTGVKLLAEMSCPVFRSRP